KKDLKEKKKKHIRYKEERKKEASRNKNPKYMGTIQEIDAILSSKVRKKKKEGLRNNKPENMGTMQEIDAIL
ncbi:hypothetical protein TorRG33x02_039960, partial [Trema orientale]